ncbi:hypothetical protein [Halomarina litorea]|uniref:hypothetical protein n=1 Tax=Halomarina litorea TaxID=2961595 RepID=UPI0020C43F42|nr:hypothetical protein [Halomarina sp. BCD28]
MTETGTPETDADGETDRRSGVAGRSQSRSAPDGGSGLRSLDRGELVRYVQYGALAVLVLVVLVATANLYTSVSAAIDVWVSDRYRPLYHAAFNAVVLLVAASGVVAVLRRR